MRKHLNKWNVFLVAVAIITAMLTIPHSQDTTEQNTGPPNDAVSVQADGLSYFDSTTDRTTLVATDDPAYIAEPCPNGPGQTQRTFALTSARIDGAYAFESEVSAPTRGTRSGLSETLNTASDVKSSRWGGLLRVVNDTGSKTVPVA